ncbi:MAG: hypothetical protein JSS29_14575 [Proteobacteria bacterium]|nr:hypothetical protein [Pseudomonadota bacterium]
MKIDSRLLIKTILLGWAGVAAVEPSAADYPTADALEPRATVVIVSLNDTRVDSVAGLLARLDDFRIGETVNLGVRRGHTVFQVQIRLQAGI